jgi:hypothetical protein
MSYNLQLPPRILDWLTLGIRGVDARPASANLNRASARLRELTSARQEENMATALKIDPSESKVSSFVSRTHKMLIIPQPLARFSLASPKAIVRTSTAPSKRPALPLRQADGRS